LICFCRYVKLRALTYRNFAIRLDWRESHKVTAGALAVTLIRMIFLKYDSIRPVKSLFEDKEQIDSDHKVKQK